MIRLALAVRREDAELVLAELLELAPNGVEESEDGELVEFAIYGAPGELPELPRLRATAGGAFAQVSSERVPDDWFDGWKRFHRPVRVSGRLVVRPPWEPQSAEGELDIVIDPGQAFGTGSHDTTRMCLEMLCELPAAGSLVDLGCGSGVLAIAAAKLGWEPVLALDHEAASVTATVDNAAANGVRLDVRRLDLRHEPIPAAPTVVANLLRPLLLTLAARPEFAPRTLVVGGLLMEQADEVATAFADRRGLVESRRRETGDWATLLLERG